MMPPPRWLLTLALPLATACTNAVDDDAPMVAGAEGDERGLVIADAHPSGADADLLVGAVDVSVWSRSLVDAEVDCFWDAGVRHLIAGSQFPEVTRRQLQVAIRGGLSVDLYVYVFWQDSLAEQIGEAVAIADQFPEVGRIWIDVEEDADGSTSGSMRPALRRPLTADELQARIQEGLDACGDFPCGIYTSRGWWQSYFEDRAAFPDVPLWYARWDRRATLSTWEGADRFGGWVRPAAKQYAEAYLCGVSVDANVIDTRAIVVPATVLLDRSTPPDDGTPPAAPVSLLPSDGERVLTEYVRLTAPLLRDADGYQIELQAFRRGDWRPYLIANRPEPARTMVPVFADTAFRFRLRGNNAHGFGPWSLWADFLFGAGAVAPTTGTSPPAP